MRQATITQIIRVGNSRGIRIPKLLLDQLDLGSEVTLVVQGDSLVIRPARRVRENWEEQCRTMHEHGDDRLLDDVPASNWDSHEWEW